MRNACQCTETQKCYDIRAEMFYRDAARDFKLPDRLHLWCMIICAHRKKALPQHAWVQGLTWRFYEQ